MPWELKETPKVGRHLAHWIWYSVIGFFLVAALAYLLWKSIEHDRNLEIKKTGQVSCPDRDQPCKQRVSFFAAEYNT